MIIAIDTGSAGAFIACGAPNKATSTALCAAIALSTAARGPTMRAGATDNTAIGTLVPTGGNSNCAERNTCC